MKKNITRDEARQEILDAANKFTTAKDRGGRVMYPRHINLAVCVVRRRKLVKPDVLIAAGFNPRERR